jgi:hypothetical protein
MPYTKKSTTGSPDHVKTPHVFTTGELRFPSVLIKPLLPAQAEDGRRLQSGIQIHGLTAIRYTNSGPHRVYSTAGESNMLYCIRTAKIDQNMKLVICDSCQADATDCKFNIL